MRIYICALLCGAVLCSGCLAAGGGDGDNRFRFNNSYSSPLMKNLDKVQKSFIDNRPQMETVTLILDIAGVRKRLPKFLLPHADGFYILKPQPNIEPISWKEYNDYISKGWAVTSMIENPDSTYTVTLARMGKGAVVPPNLDELIRKKEQKPPSR